MTQEMEQVGEVPPSLVEAVQDYIRDRIVSGEYLPGQRLVERELAQATGASRIPVREAIRGLASERLVTLIPRCGAVVSELVPENLNEIFEVREALEMQECGLAAQRATQPEIEKLREFVHAASEALSAGDLAGVDAANAGFHDALAVMSHNSVLSAMLAPLKSRLRWILRQNPDPGAICREHEQLASAIEERDIERARELARAHVETSKQLALGVLFGEDGVAQCSLRAPEHSS